MSKDSVNLYEIANEINEIVEMVDENWVLLPEAEIRFTELQMDKTQKFKNIGWLIKNLAAYEEAAKIEKQRIDLNRKIAANKVERLKAYLKMIMIKNGDKEFTTWTFKFSFRKSSSIEVVDASKLPKIYQKITIEANKTALKEALEAGKKIKGVSVVPGQNLQIS